jgi:hypothetical protein
MLQTIKSKQGKCLLEKGEVLDRWAEYVEELYKDENRGEIDMGDLVHEMFSISQEEIETVIRELPKGKANIYKSGYIPEDFRNSVFVPIAKINRAQECGDFRTIALISHASKVLLHLLKRRITPIIERQLGDSQMGFRKGKGTRDAIFQLRMISERVQQMNIEKEISGKKKTAKKPRKLYLCFVDYQKAFDRVKHDKLAEVMEKAGIPELERRLIINLYWKQQAAIRWNGEISREVKVERGVRQGCVISPYFSTCTVSL